MSIQPAAIGIVRRPQRQCLQQGGKIGIRKYEARWIERASGLLRSRFLSQSRIATRSSLSAALTNASKNWSRCPASSLDQPCIVAATRSMRRIRVPY